MSKRPEKKRGRLLQEQREQSVASPEDAVPSSTEYMVECLVRGVFRAPSDLPGVLFLTSDERHEREKISWLSDGSIRRLYNEARGKLVEAERERRAFFNQPDAIAENPYWARAALWTIDEAVALLLEKDPRKVSWERLRSCTDIWRFARDYEDLMRLLLRAVEATELHKKNTPLALITWAKSRGSQVPVGLACEIEALNAERDSLLAKPTAGRAQKPGRKPSWSKSENLIKIRDHVWKELEHHGLPDPHDPDWKNQADVERSALRFCHDLWRSEPSEGWMRGRVAEWLSEYKDKKDKNARM